MAHEQVPDDRAEPLGVGRHARGGHRRDDDAGLGDLLGVAPVAADDAEHRSADLACELERAHEVHRHVLLAVAAADREDEQRVARAQARALEPLGEAGVPALVVDPRGELGDVVGRGVGLEAADLPEVVDGVAGVTRRAADAEDEEAAAAVAHAREALGERLDRGDVELLDEGDALFEELGCEGHAWLREAYTHVARPGEGLHDHRLCSRRVEGVAPSRRARERAEP